MKTFDRVLVRRFVVDDTRPVRWFAGTIVRRAKTRYGSDTHERFDVRLDDGSVIWAAHPASIRPVETI